MSGLICYPCYVDCSYMEDFEDFSDWFVHSPESPPPELAWPSTWYEDPRQDPDFILGLAAWLEYLFKFQPQLFYLE